MINIKIFSGVNFWLGRMSPKWPLLCRVGRKTLARLLISCALCMCYLANWNPVETPITEFLKTSLLDLEVVILVWCWTLYSCFVFKYTVCGVILYHASYYCCWAFLLSDGQSVWFAVLCSFVRISFGIVFDDMHVSLDCWHTWTIYIHGYSVL